MKPRTDKTEHPLLVAASMARAYRSGEKTQTRRILTANGWNPNGIQFGCVLETESVPRAQAFFADGRGTGCPYGKVGHKLWLRETWAAAVQDPKGPADCLYRADDNSGVEDLEDVPWKPSIHMPRRYCQTVLTINDLRVERLQAITDQDALLEGVTEWFRPRAEELKKAGIAAPDRPRYLFQLLWTSLYGQEAWDANPYVWVICTDKVVTK